jgi:hypothetical protein
MIGLVCLFFESILPLIANYLFRSAEWDIISESKFTRICERIANFHMHLVNLQTRLVNTRKQKQSLVSYLNSREIFCWGSIAA